MKYWEIIADNLHKARMEPGLGLSFECAGPKIWIADAHCGGKRYVLRADEKLTAFLELQRGDTRVRGEFDGVIAAQKPARG